MTGPGPERLTPALRRALALAAEDARGRGHGHLGTGHLLMGVLGAPDGGGAAVLATLEVLLHYVDAEIVRVAGYGRRSATGELGEVSAEDVFGPPDAPARRWFQRHTPLSPSSAAQVALQHASEVGDAAVGTEHLVLGLAESSGGLARRILIAHGATADRVREALHAS